MLKVLTYPTCATSSDCESDFQICSAGECICKPTYYLNYAGMCARCPDYGQLCASVNCCSDLSMECGISGYCSCRNGIENSQICSSSTPIFITAPQIALSAALLMGMAALTMVIYRLCTKPRYLSARQRALASRSDLNFDSESITYANYLRNSLTSIQIRVLTRLRDRPPTYDSRQVSPTLPEAPPPYEGPTEGLPLPPAYTELVLSPAGYVNSSFVSVDTESSSTRNTDRDRSNTNENQHCDTTPPSTDENCDKSTEETVDEKSDASQENRIPV